MIGNLQLFDGILIFCSVVKLGSFTATAKETGFSTSHISKEISKLEKRLSTRLLNRTTRSIRLTSDGEAYYQQCLQLIADAEEAEAFSHQKTPTGHLKISAPINFAINTLYPKINQYMQSYPNVTFEVDLNDRKVDLIAEGFDLAVRIATSLEDSSLVSRKISRSHAVTVATPEYLARHGTPTHPRELSDHNCICYTNLTNRRLWQYRNAKETISVQVKSNLSTNNADMELAFLLDHMGIARLPLFIVEHQIEQGKLICLLEDYLKPPIDIYVIYPSRKQQSRKLTTFIDCLLASS